MNSDIDALQALPAEQQQESVICGYTCHDSCGTNSGTCLITG